MTHQTDFNPVAQSRLFALRNVLDIVRSQPRLSALLGIATVGLVWLLFHVFLAVIGQHSTLLERFLLDRAFLVWPGLFALSVGSLMPLAKQLIVGVDNVLQLHT